MAVPAYLCVAVGVFLCLYLGANLLLVPALEDPRTVSGELSLGAETNFPLKARLLALVPKLLVNLQSIARQLDVSSALPSPLLSFALHYPSSPSPLLSVLSRSSSTLSSLPASQDIGPTSS